MTSLQPTSRGSLIGIVIALTVLLSGCNVGPKYVRPNVTAPPVFRGPDDRAVSSASKDSLGDEQWTAVYKEPELQDLIRKALVNNYDVRIAAQRILEAQAQVSITRSQQLPSATVGGTAVGAALPSSLGTQIPSPLVNGSFNVSAAWTPDFWGLYRRQTEAARAELLARSWAKRAVQLTLVQQVAGTYLQIRALDRQLEITRQTIKVRQDSVDLTRTLESGGSVPLSDVRQAEQLLYTATSQVPQIEEQIQQQENAISLLLGENPGPILHKDPNALTPPPRTCPRVYRRSCLNVVRTSRKQRPGSSQRMRRSESLALSSFLTSRSVDRAESAAIVFRASSIPLGKQSTASAPSLSHYSKVESSGASSNSRRKQSRKSS